MRARRRGHISPREAQDNRDRSTVGYCPSLCGTPGIAMNIFQRSYGPLKKNDLIREGMRSAKRPFFIESSCPPHTGQDLAPGDHEKLVRLSWRHRARNPRPLCMKTIRAELQRETQC